MEHVSPDTVESFAFGNGSIQHCLADALETTDVALNRYRLAPGDGLPSGLHAHMDQEEVFLVVAGEATFEMLDGDVTVSEGEAVRFGPGEFQSGRNDAESETVILALGAPRDSTDVHIPVTCWTCGHDTVRIETGSGRLTFACPACDTEQTPKDCPDCGHDDLRVTRAEQGRTNTVCQGCGAAFDRPPVETE